MAGLIDSVDHVGSRLEIIDVVRQEIEDAAIRVEGARAVANLAVLHVRLRPFRAGTAVWTGQRTAGPWPSMVVMPRRIGCSCCLITPCGTQVQGVVRRYVTEQLGDQPLRVAALDESGQEKSAAATAGVKR